MNKVGWRVLVNDDWNDNSKWRYLIASEGAEVHLLLSSAIEWHSSGEDHIVTLVDSFGCQTGYSVRRDGTSHRYEQLSDKSVRESVALEDTA